MRADDRCMAGDNRLDMAGYDDRSIGGADRPDMTGFGDKSMAGPDRPDMGGADENSMSGGEIILPENLRKDMEKEKENALTLYLDFLIDGTASMYSVYPAVYFAALHFLECLARYEVEIRLGITVMRSQETGEETERIAFDDGSFFTGDMTRFLKKLKNIPLYGGGDDGFESVHRAIMTSLLKFPGTGRNKAMMIFTDARGSDDYCEYMDYPLGQVIFFCTEELSEEDFRFCFVREDGSYDQEASPMFISFEKLLKPLSTELMENVAKPLKDLMKGVSIGL